MALRYVTDDTPGFTRASGWLSRVVYKDAQGKRIRDKKTLARIRALGIPPAYTDVWICPSPHGHIQATARDARHRKQYIYHPEWIVKRDEGKFHRLLVFAKSLSRIRRHVSHDVRARGMPKEKVLATLVMLLDTVYVRIGNEEYAKENHSFGLTTLRNRHVKGSGAHMKFLFRGKEGIVHEVPLEDARVRKIVATCQDIPGHMLFEYRDDDGTPHPVHSEDVNAYLKEISAEDITAKDFRTWHGTLIAASYLWKHPFADTKREAQQDVTSATKRAAEALGNTVSICKKSYIHPQVFAHYQNGTFIWRVPTEAFRKKYPLLHQEEVALAKFLDASDIPKKK